MARTANSTLTEDRREADERIGQLLNELDQLRKVADDYSECHIIHEENCNENIRPSRPCDCAIGKINTAYNQLPHVIERNK